MRAPAGPCMKATMAEYSQCSFTNSRFFTCSFAFDRARDDGEPTRCDMRDRRSTYEPRSIACHGTASAQSRYFTLGGRCVHRCRIARHRCREYSNGVNGARAATSTHICVLPCWSLPLKPQPLVPLAEMRSSQSADAKGATSNEGALWAEASQEAFIRADVAQAAKVLRAGRAARE